MEKSIIKNIFVFHKKKKVYVARLIEDGGTLWDILDWHKARFRKPIARSKYFRLKSQTKNILGDKLDK